MFLKTRPILEMYDVMTYCSWEETILTKDQCQFLTLQTKPCFANTSNSVRRLCDATRQGLVPLEEGDGGRQ